MAPGLELEVKKVFVVKPKEEKPKEDKDKKEEKVDLSGKPKDNK